jgi:hypothetical protein
LKQSVLSTYLHNSADLLTVVRRERHAAHAEPTQHLMQAASTHNEGG